MIVKSVARGGIAEELGILPGEALLSINGEVVRDIIDYSYLIAEEDVLLTMRTAEGELYEAEAEKEAYSDIGLEFERDGLKQKFVCKNKCLFCFVDQMPRGLRKTLYVKDDDWRLSFLMGSYVTLTNLSEAEIERILAQRISPIYISVHAADDDLRVKLLGTEAARSTFELVKRFAAGGIAMHTQIVMCEGLNDAAQLTKTLEALCELRPAVRSVAVVPAGLTKYREGLPPIAPVSRACAADAAARVAAVQARSLAESGERFAFASDELYIRAGSALPAFEEYEDFPQIENGVGLIAKLTREVEEAVESYAGSAAREEAFHIITGVDARPYIEKLAERVRENFGADITVHAVRNDFFGESVTVAGLLTGGDIIAQLSGKLGGVALLPRVCFRENTEQMLDGVTLEALSKALDAACRVIDVDGYCFVEAFLETEEIDG